jgi:nucleoside-diphosphate-sugar epimerase
MDKQKVLVTGSEGYLGRYLVDGLEDGGYIVYRFDCRESSRQDKDTPFIRGDIRDKKVVDRAVEIVDFVVHAAAALSQFQPDEKVMREINIGGTANMLDASKRHGIKKFIFVSSVEVYGPLHLIPCPEDAPLEPICEYGRNKLEGERMALEYHLANLPVVILRPPTIAGPGQNEPYLLDQFKAVVKGEKVVIPGKGAVRLQMVDARDVTAAVLLALKNPQADGQIFNLGSRDVPTLRETIEALFRRMGMEPRLLCLPEKPIKAIINAWAKIGKPPISPQHLELAFRDSIFAIDRAVKVLNWEPNYTDLQSNLETLDWFLYEQKGKEELKA